MREIDVSKQNLTKFSHHWLTDRCYRSCIIVQWQRIVLNDTHKVLTAALHS